MLEDPSFHPVVSWGPEGDCFVVKDMNEFTKTILPKMFKHSNFASFVRQLNKYDFHKVKNAESTPGGDQAWTFKHPDFHAKRRDALENIKRKVPSQRKAQQAATATGNTATQGQSPENAVSREEYENL
jgi:osomolarity two-component system response regulator SKN7